MKKQFFLALLAVIFTTTLFAQSSEKKAPNALTKIALLKLSAAGVGVDKMGKTFPVFFEYYSMKQKIEEAVAAGEMKADPKVELAKLISNRDESLKTLFTEAEMKTFKNKLEAELVAEENK
jgi:hypothetical protein